MVVGLRDGRRADRRRRELLVLGFGLRIHGRLGLSSFLLLLRHRRDARLLVGRRRRGLRATRAARFRRRLRGTDERVGDLADRLLPETGGG